MDEIGPQMEGFVMVLLAMLGLMSLLLALGLGWAGWRRVRRGGVRVALVVTNALVAATLITVALLLAGGELRSPMNPWLVLLVFFYGPMLAGYGLGTTAALLRRRDRTVS